MTESTATPWLSARAAAMRIGTNIPAVHKLAMRGEIRVKCDPGVAIKFNLEDVERIKRERQTADAS